MSKIRVYELAKELGLENRALLDLCEQLDISGKTSHSNSLSDDEAEKIRRFVIRSAVSEKNGGVRELRREGHLLTERRVGKSVIRRRKKSDEEPQPEVEASEESGGEKVDLNELRDAREFPNLAPDLAAERRQRDAALERADALFKPKEDVTSAPEEVSVTESEPEPEPQPELVAAAEEAQEEQAPEPTPPVEEPPVVEAQAEVVAEPEPVAVEEPVQASEDAAVEGEAKEEPTKPEPDPEAEAAKAEDAAAAERDRLNEVRKRLDIRAPKVLGRIELPTKPAPRESAASAGEETAARARKKTKKVAVSAGAEPAPGGGPADSRRSDRRKPRKKQVLSKKELVDYEGDRELWKGKRDRKRRREEAAPPVRVTGRTVKVDGQITVGELAKQMGMKAGEVMSQLMNLGIMANINQLVDFETASIVAEEAGHKAQNIEQDVEALVDARTVADDPEAVELRPPVVTVMGHVDHGKTSLLDAIRRTSVTTGEFGGITQHIGAYNVKLAGGGSVTFLDTPGHEAFTAMRSRGAQLTDIVVLVVAADDGVMPQTIEAINHAKAADVPIIVAINKMDVEEANPDRVINQLAEHGLVPEDWGGDTLMVRVSAHTRDGIDALLENLHLQAEILELRANPNRSAVGTVIESKVDKGRGPVISVLVQNGMLKKGDAFVAGAVYGRVRAMTADDGSAVEEAGPSIPVEVLGASAPALSGDDFVIVEGDSQARQIAEERAQRRRRKEFAASANKGAQVGAPLTLESFAQMVTDSAELKELPLIIKADVQGTVEAVADALSELSNEEVKVRIIHKGVGAISENDVQLASASQAILVAFNVRPDARANPLIEQEGVEVLYSRVIYDLVDSVNSALRGKMAPKYQEKTLGHVEVRQTFRVPKLGMVAGSYVRDGSVPRGAKVRLLRDGVVVYEGKLSSLRRFKEDVREVASGYECGIGLEGFSDIKDGDVMEIYKVEEVQP